MKFIQLIILSALGAWLFAARGNAKTHSINKIEVPILCYHHIREHTEGKSPDYTISVKEFRSHIKMLSDSGYNAILPDLLYKYLAGEASLPPRPIIVTFDDTHQEHFSIAAPALKSAGFRGVFFIMAVTIGKPGYMTAHQIKELSDSGHVTGCHTWDHPDVRKLTGSDWELQVDKPKRMLEQLTGKPVLYFGYPFGVWNEASIQELKKRNYHAAFQLSGKRSEKEPLYTIRRLMVSGNWSAATLHQRINQAFLGW
jgi:peptidoglycan/xylan/chitin deacetylase (PgdA/CDA1 family)